MTENKRQRFERLAEARTEKALNAIRVIGNLANQNQYEYGAEDVNAIAQALRKEIRELEARFQGHERPRFSLRRRRRSERPAGDRAQSA